MGYDCYMKWKGQGEEEEKAQFTGFSLVHGHVGYLRESYAGEHRALSVLIPDEEAYSDDGVAIPASVLRERLPYALKAVAVRYAEAGSEFIAKVSKSYTDFVELAEAKERETMEPVTIAIH